MKSASTWLEDVPPDYISVKKFEPQIKSVIALMHITISYNLDFLYVERLARLLQLI